jgi:hypothetical protein
MYLHQHKGLRKATLEKLRVVLQHEPQPSPLVQHLADYVSEQDPVRKRQVARRFYTRLNKAMENVSTTKDSTRWWNSFL